MNEILFSTIAGIIQGLTEFLPVSSTAHLVLASRVLDIVPTDFTKRPLDPVRSPMRKRIGRRLRRLTSNGA